MAAVKVYVRRGCGYCHMAEALLNDREVAYERIDVTGDSATRAWLVEVTGGLRTVPQIFIAGKSIGGYTDLLALDRSGALDELLDELVAE